MSENPKPDPPRSYSSWFSNSHARSRAAQDAISGAIDQGLRDQVVRIEADSTERHNQNDTNNRFSDRIATLRNWIDLLRRSFEYLNRRLELMLDLRFTAENFMNKVQGYRSMNRDSLTHLDHRRNGEHVTDPVLNGLRDEQNILRTVEENLQRVISSIYTAIIPIQDKTRELEEAIQEKEDALQIEISLLNTTENSPNVSNQFPSSTSDEPERIHDQVWEDTIRELRTSALNMVAAASRQIEELHTDLHHCRSLAENQADEVNFAIDTRIHETRRASEELARQQESLQQQRQNLENELRYLNESRAAKVNSRRLAQTRLQLRNERPAGENVEDAVNEGLRSEIAQLDAAIAALDEQEAKTRSSLLRLEEQLAEVCQDQRNKQDARRILQDIMGLRCSTMELPLDLSSPPCPVVPDGIVRNLEQF